MFDFSNDFDIDNDNDGVSEYDGDCDDNDGNIGVLECTDDDGDGFSEYQGDCDDRITPSRAAELDSQTLCMQDIDKDGYGDSNPNDSVRAGSDCDDNDSTISPEQDEVCDTIDNN